MEAKKDLRQAVQLRLLAQSVQDRARRSKVVETKLWSCQEFQKAKWVFFFVSMPEEVDTHTMIDRALAEGKRVAVPCSDLKAKKLFFYEISDRNSHLKPGACGILEPDSSRGKEVAPTQATCVIVPGVVFDKKNHRIGHGAGFYDRFLDRLDPTIKKIGLAYSFQVMIKDLPQEVHDVVLDEVITD